jgi:hypothetical protein
VNTLIRIYGVLSNFKGYFLIRPFALTSLFILTVFSSCNDREKYLAVSVEGIVKDQITHEPIDHATVTIKCYEGGLFGVGTATLLSETQGFTDSNGHFLIVYEDNGLSWGKIFARKSRYFEYYDSFITNPDEVNIAMIPHGYVKTHIINKIDTGRLNVNISHGNISCGYMLQNFADTTLISTVYDGVEQRLRIDIYPTYINPNNFSRLVKDTSFLTLRFDTVHINIKLFK